MKNYVNAAMAGISAYCDQYIISENGELYYGSFYGGGEAVKAVVSGTLSNNRIALDGKEYTRCSLNMTYESARLSNAVTHIVMYVPELFIINGQATFILTGQDYNDIAKKSYDILMKCRPTPLIAEWRDFIIQEQIWINELISFGYPMAAMVNLPEEEALEGLIMDNIKYLSEQKL